MHEDNLHSQNLEHHWFLYHVKSVIFVIKINVFADTTVVKRWFV